MKIDKLPILPAKKALEELHPILTNPFGLILFTEYYQEHHSSDKVNETTLIEFYVNKQLANSLLYTKEEVEIWLGYTAKFIETGETLQIETLSPKKVLNIKQQAKYKWLFTSLFGAIFGLMLGSIGGLMFGELTADKVITNNIILPEILMNIHYSLIAWYNS